MSRIRPALLLGGVLGAVRARRRRGQATTILMSGSTSVYPLSTALAQALREEVPEARSSSRSPRAARTSASATSPASAWPIGASSRDLQSGDPGGLVFNKIARDGVCVVTHPDNAIANLSQQQVQDIFSGRVRRWDDVEGAKVTGPINLNVRTQASGTQDAFRNIFMGQNLNVAPSASQKSTNGLVQAAVAQRPAGDRLRRLQVHRAARTRSRTRASPATCATPSPASTRASVTSGSSRSASRRARPRSSSTSRARLPCRAASSRRTTCRTSSERLVV